MITICLVADRSAEFSHGILPFVLHKPAPSPKVLACDRVAYTVCHQRLPLLLRNEQDRIVERVLKSERLMEWRAEQILGEAAAKLGLDWTVPDDEALEALAQQLELIIKTSKLRSCRQWAKPTLRPWPWRQSNHECERRQPSIEL